VKKKIADLLKRVKKTARSKYRASERLEQHHRFAQGTIALLCCLMIFIPLAQVMEVSTGYSTQAMNLAAVFIAVIVLIYSLLLSQEKYTLRSEAMNKDGMELGKLARKLEGLVDRNVPEEEYHSLVNKYYHILEQGEGHKTIDYMFIRLDTPPQELKDWPFFLVNILKAYGWYFILFFHYIVALIIAVVGLLMLGFGVYDSYHLNP